MRTKNIVILSGKGGVGKSMLASALSMLFSLEKKTIALDCDVDTPNLAIWLNEEGGKIISTTNSLKPEIDKRKCDGCGLCVENCQFSALIMEKKYPKLNPFICEGCGACKVVCPKGAISLRPVQNGEIKIIMTKYGFPLIYGRLFPGESGSGKIVSKIKEKAEKFIKEKDIVIIDSAPGTGCPVIASVRGSDYAILVVEPTISGVSDMKKALSVVNYFNVPFGIVVNKWDINKRIFKSIEKQFKNKILGKISYNKEIFKAISSLTPIMESSLEAKNEIKKIYLKLLTTICA